MGGFLAIILNVGDSLALLSNSWQCRGRVRLVLRTTVSLGEHVDAIPWQPKQATQTGVGGS